MRKTRQEEDTPQRSTGRWLLVFIAILVAPPARAAELLKGVVVGADRAPVAGAKMILAGEPSPAAAAAMETVSTDDGWFAFESVPRGVYLLKCSHDGFLPYVSERIFVDDHRPHALIVVTLRTPEGRDAATDESGDVLERLRRSTEEIPKTQTRAAVPYPFKDRWRIDLPPWDRYPGRGILDTPFRQRGIVNPYPQNILKGDFPVLGQNTFIVLTAVSDTFYEARTLPTPSGQSGASADPERFFGGDKQKQGASTLLFSFEMFHGNAAFRPVDWRFRLTAGAQYNDLAVRERGIVNIDVREGTDRTDDHLGPQEAFVEVKLGDLGVRYDFVSVRTGVQAFLSDFRGFLYQDNQPGVRLFGSFAANRGQWNLAGFEMLEKDTNSGLNSAHRRNQRVGIANVYFQDFLVPGYTLELSAHANVDRAGNRDPDGLHFDENGFLVRPAAIGDFTPHDLRAFYVGAAGDGHIGRLDLSDAIYLARGVDDHNPIAGRQVRIRATMAAAELSYDRDWLRYRVSAFYASGDKDPSDSVGTGFDTILDNPNFAGGAASFWNRQGLRLTGTNVGLTGRFSLVPDLRSSKDEGQANFVNPGLFLYNVGVDAELTPRLKLQANVNYVRFDTTEVIDSLLLQGPISRRLGLDASLLAVYRPALTDNVVLSGGIAGFRPSKGFTQIFEDKVFYQAFADIVLTY